jgi:hypothetical protein
MHEIVGDIWDYLDKGWIVIPTNGIVKKNGEAVMGGGLALDAALRFGSLPGELGSRLKNGNYVYYFREYKIITFPTKHHYAEPSDLDLIIKSAQQLNSDLKVFRLQGQTETKFFIPRVGCGLGGLSWNMVKPAIMPYLNEPEFVFIRPPDHV